MNTNPDNKGKDHDNSITQEHMEIVNERFEEYLRNPNIAIDFDSAMDDIEKSLTENDDSKSHTLPGNDMTSEEFKTWINSIEKESLIELSEAKKQWDIQKQKIKKNSLDD